jgi:hypothetical protein
MLTLDAAVLVAQLPRKTSVRYDGLKVHLPWDGLKEHLRDGLKVHLPWDGLQVHLPWDGLKVHPNLEFGGPEVCLP